VAQAQKKFNEIILCFYAKAFNINFQLKHATDFVVVVVATA